jgi:hypothetical protein
VFSSGGNNSRRTTPGHVRHRRQTVNTPDSTTASPRLESVKDLLEQLHSMKADGLGARERLDFLMSSGPELVKDFSYEHAFDLEARTRAAKLEQLEDLRQGFGTLESTWHAAPLIEDVREAGRALFKHLKGFVNEALGDERKAEIETLSQVWDRSPDIRWLYPWLTAWTGPVRDSSKPDAIARHEAEFVKEAKEALEDEITGENIEGDELEAEFERQIRELDHAEFIRRDYELSGDYLERQREISEQLKDPAVRARLAGAPLEEASGSSPEDLAQLRQEAWTQALRDVSLETWEFRTEVAGHLGDWGQGTALLWKHGLESHSSARLEWAPSREGHVNVRLFVSSEKLGARELKREVSDAQLAELHVDPSSFVQAALG